MLRAWQHSHDLVKNLEIGPITMGSDNSVTQPFYHLTNADTSVLVDCRQRLPAIVYVGSRLASVEEADLALVDRHEAPASLPTETPIALLPDATSGWLGHPGIAVRKGAARLAAACGITAGEPISERRPCFVSGLFGHSDPFALRVGITRCWQGALR